MFGLILYEKEPWGQYLLQLIHQACMALAHCLVIFCRSEPIHRLFISLSPIFFHLFALQNHSRSLPILHTELIYSWYLSQVLNIELNALQRILILHVLETISFDFSCPLIVLTAFQFCWFIHAQVNWWWEWKVFFLLILVTEA